MAQDSMVVHLPVPLFRRLERAAALTHRSVDEVLATTVAAAFVAPDDLPEALAGELASMHLLSDDALRAAALPSLSAAGQARLGQLNALSGERDLTAAEQAEQLATLDQYRLSALRRGQALAILAQRGHPMDDATLASPFVDPYHASA